MKEPTHREFQMEAAGFQLDAVGFWLESFEWASGLLRMQRKKHLENQRFGLKGCRGRKEEGEKEMKCNLVGVVWVCRVKT